MTDPAHLTDVAAVLDDRMATHRDDLEVLVRIPSVSVPGFDPAEVRRSAVHPADWAKACLGEAYLFDELAGGL